MHMYVFELLCSVTDVHMSSTLFGWVTDVRMCHLNRKGGLPMYIYILCVIILSYRCAYMFQVVT